MKLKVHPALVVAVYLITQAAIELSKEFNTVGAEQLSHYTPWQWLVLIVGMVASLGVTLKAYIDPSYHDYQNGKLPILPSEPETKTAKESANEQAKDSK